LNILKIIQKLNVVKTVNVKSMKKKKLKACH
jgi:hypothetical protein